MDNNFDLNKVKEYVTKRQEYLNKRHGDTTDKSLNLNAIFSVFDKNFDGKISRNEFGKISKAEYEQYAEALKAYNTQQGNEAENKSIWSYEQLSGCLEDAFIEMNELEYGKYKEKDSGNVKGLDEARNLKDINQMEQDEIIEELESYGIETKNANPKKLKNMLKTARNERAIQDRNSDIVDGHIGTFVQDSTSSYCTILAQLDTMSDEEIAQMCEKEPKIDENGKKYWEVQFPCDFGTDIYVTVTEEDLQNKTVTIKDENNEEREIADFPKGDDDVTLLLMAYVKRFGAVEPGGLWSFDTQNKFTPPHENKKVDNQHLEDVIDFSTLPKHSQINILNKDELTRKGIDTSGNNGDLSWIPPQNMMYSMTAWGSITLSDGEKGCYGPFGVYLSDGTYIPAGHALSVRGYDAKTNELIITCNDYNNISEVRVPAELAKFFETASEIDFPGAKKTPQPEL